MDVRSTSPSSSASSSPPDDFGDLDEPAARILAFENHRNAQARPFDWRFTRAGLNQVPARIRKHDRFSPLPMAA
jgi:hypothetical protein